MAPTENTGERGVALLIVLLVLLFTSILAVDLKSTASLHKRLATNRRDDFLMRQRLRGQVEILKQLLLLDQEENNLETLDDRWLEDRYTAFQSLPDEEEEDEEAAEPVSSEDFELTARIEDEARKFNLHNLVVEDDDLRAHWEKVFVRLLMIYREDDSRSSLSQSEAEDLLRNLKEWLDRQDEDRAPRPHTILENRILITPDELLMVKGFTRDIFYDLPPEDEEDESPPGLYRYLTLWSEGPINVNTADEPVVHALFEDGDRDLADLFLSWRAEEAEDQEGNPDPEDDPDMNAVSSAQDLAKVDGIDPEDLQRNLLNATTVTGRSNSFSIHLEGESSEGLRRQERWVLQRNSVGFTTLLFEERHDPIYTAEEEE